MYTYIEIVRRDVLPRYAIITACVAVVGRAAGLQRVKYFLEFVELRRCVPPRERTIFWWAQSADQIFFSKQA